MLLLGEFSFAVKESFPDGLPGLVVEIDPDPEDPWPFPRNGGFLLRKYDAS